MKKIFTLIFAISLSLNMLGQCPLSTAVDFTATDCYGSYEVNLFDILDRGQYVLIDFFFTTCTPCQQAVPKLVESCSYFGCNMHDVYYIEISDRDSDAACQSWAENYDVFYPTISGEGGGSTISDQYMIGSYPTVILIAPDHSIVIHDLYPISSTQTIVEALTPYGIQPNNCTPGGDIMPDFTGTDIKGNEINLYSILDAGQFVLINFFLSGDPYSQNIMGDMVEAYRMYGCNDHDVFFIEISPNGGDNACQTWAETYGVRYPTISRDGGGNEIAQSIPVAMYPTIMLISPDHTIAQRDIYPPTLEYMVQYMTLEGIIQYECEDGVDETVAENIALYPNPAGNSLKIDRENLGNVVIFNALGQKIDEFEADNNELNINTSNYQNGIYVVKIGDKMQKFVVNH